MQRRQNRISKSRYALLVLAFGLDMVGCAASSQLRPIAPGHLDLAKALPAPGESPFGLAFGGKQAGRAITREGQELDAYLKTDANAQAPAPAAQLPLHAARTATRTRTTPANVATAAPPLVAELTPAKPVPSASPLAATDPRSDAARYAQREDKKLERYRGGDVVVIGVSTLVVILLIVLLVVLLIR